MKFRFYNLFSIKNEKLNILVNALISLVVTIALILLTYFLKIPNPNLILFSGLIVLASLFGPIPGLMGLFGVWFYTLFFFSNYTFTDFSEVNATKTVVSFITSTICYIFVSTLNYFYEKNTNKMLEDNRKLKDKNEALKEISSIDALTLTKNRQSLRNDFDSFINQEVYLLIYDVDEFKSINDTYGHLIGDEVLKNIASITKEMFSDHSAYRFGGDEFIVIETNMTLSIFKKKIKAFMKEVENIKVSDVDIILHISVGYTYGVPSNNMEIREMIRFADDLLYKVKKNGKNNLSGKRFELDLIN